MHTALRRTPHGLFLLACCGALTMPPGCSDIDVHSNYAPSESLVALPMSYDWAQSTREQPDAWNHRTEMRDLVMADVEKRFTARGYTRQANSPGFYVRLHPTRETRTDSSVNPHGETFEKIALIMDVIKPSTGKVLWRGAATARLDSTANPEQRRGRISQATQMLVDRFADGNK